MARKTRTILGKPVEAMETIQDLIGDEEGYEKQPKAWPKHLMPWNPVEKNRVNQIGFVTLYPYDTTKSKVKTWVAISGDKFLGMIQQTKDADGKTLYIAAMAWDGHSKHTPGNLFHHDLTQAVNFLEYPIR